MNVGPAPHPAVRLRKWTDIEALAATLSRVHKLDGYPAAPPKDLNAFIDSPKCLTAWVFEHDGVVLGHAALHSVQSEAIQALAVAKLDVSAEELISVSRVFVAPEARGRGVGRALLTTATAAAQLLGKQPILDVVVTHAPAIALYESAGWSCIGAVQATFSGRAPIEEYVYAAPGPKR